MLKIAIEAPEDNPHGRHITCEIHGDLHETLTDTFAALNAIYTGMDKRGPTQAALFRASLLLGLMDDDCPVWDPDWGDKVGIHVHAVVPKKKEEKQND